MNMMVTKHPPIDSSVGVVSFILHLKAHDHTNFNFKFEMSHTMEIRNSMDEFKEPSQFSGCGA